MTLALQIARSLVIVVGISVATEARAEIRVESAWVRETPGKMTMTAGYARIVNDGSQTDELMGVTAAEAGSAEVHQTVRDGGMMKMEPVEKLKIAAHGEIKIEPGGYHLMITDLKRKLVPGETLQMTFRFARGGEIAVQAKVAPISATRAP